MLRFRCLLAVAFICLAVSGFAQESSGIRMSRIRIGLDNATKPGLPTPVMVTVDTEKPFRGELSLVTPDPQGDLVRIDLPIEHLEAGAQTWPVLISFGRLETWLAVELRQNQTLIAQRRLTSAGIEPEFQILRHDQPFWLIIGDLPLPSRTTDSSDAGPAKTGTSRSESQRSAGQLLAGVKKTQLASAADVPISAQLLSVYNTVLVSGEFGLSTEQAEVLEKWVQDGGELVAAVGSRVSEFNASPLATWMLGSGRSVRTASIGDLGGLETYAATNFHIPIVARVQGSLLTVTDGQAIISGIDGALVARSAHGFGRITLLGVDLDKRPLAQWRGREEFVATLTELPRTMAAAQPDRPERISHVGITDLASQLHTASADFPEAADRSVLGLLGFIVLYLLVVGPADYLIVHRLLKRPELTWVTMPVAVLLATLLAGVSASSSSGMALAATQTEIIDVDAVSRFTRQHVSWSLYSPENRRYEVQFEPETTNWPQSGIAQFNVTWSAIPESTYLGMYRPAGLELSRIGYRIAPREARIDNLPVGAGSTRSLHAESTGKLSEVPVESRLRRVGVGQLSQDSELTHRFPVPIDEWLLAYDGRVYFHSVRDAGLDASSAIAPGQRWSPHDRAVLSRELRSFLTGSTYRVKPLQQGKGGEESVLVQDQYDVKSTGLSDILRMVSFHETAGGQNYTSLTNWVLDKHDFSKLLSLDRAVLFARLDLPAANVRVDGRPVQASRRTTYVRILLPVDDQDRRPDTLPKFNR